MYVNSWLAGGTEALGGLVKVDGIGLSSNRSVVAVVTSIEGLSRSDIRPAMFSAQEGVKIPETLRSG